MWRTEPKTRKRESSEKLKFTDFFIPSDPLCLMPEVAAFMGLTGKVTTSSSHRISSLPGKLLRMQPPWHDQISPWHGRMPVKLMAAKTQMLWAFQGVEAYVFSLHSLFQPFQWKLLVAYPLSPLVWLCCCP